MWCAVGVEIEERVLDLDGKWKWEQNNSSPRVKYINTLSPSLNHPQWFSPRAMRILSCDIAYLTTIFIYFIFLGRWCYYSGKKKVEQVLPNTQIVFIV